MEPYHSPVSYDNPSWVDGVYVGTYRIQLSRGDKAMFKRAAVAVTVEGGD